MSNLLIKNGSLINCNDSICKICDILITNGIIEKVSDNIDEDSVHDVRIIDVRGLYVSTGLVDIHTHLRDPGFTHKEDISSGIESAVRGGFTTIMCMANTYPVVDNLETLRYVIKKAKISGKTKVFPIASVTKNLDGKNLINFKALRDAGCVGFSDDGVTIRNLAILAMALKTVDSIGSLVLCHCDIKEIDRLIVSSKAFNEFEVSKLSKFSEEIAVSEVLNLANCLNSRIHLCHISTTHSVKMIKKAKMLNSKITCETAPHYFSLNSEMVKKYGTNAKMNPPLRSEEDRLAIIEALKDGTIDVIASDHAPHTEEEKNVPFENAPNGIIGLETSFAVSYTYLVESGEITLYELIKKMSLNPRKMFALGAEELRPGEVADITIFDLNQEFIVDKKYFKSKSKNSPFIGSKLKGKIIYTIIDGSIC